MGELIVIIASIFGMMLIPVVAMVLNSMMSAVSEDRKDEGCRTIVVPNRTEIDRTEYMTRGYSRSSLGAIDYPVERSKYDADLDELIP